MLHRLETLPHLQVARYIANGLLATAVHFSVLQINLKLLGMTSAGLANFIAAFFWHHRFICRQSLLRLSGPSAADLAAGIDVWRALRCNRLSARPGALCVDRSLGLGLPDWLLAGDCATSCVELLEQQTPGIQKMKKIYPAFLATAIFIFVLLGTYWVHIAYFKVNVVLYSAIADGVLATLVAVILLFRWRGFNILSGFDKLQLAVIWLLGSYIFAISIPTVIDRSLSFYILEKIQQRGGGIQLSKFEEVFTKEYVREQRLVDVRLTEQQESGTIKIENGCVKLTPRGDKLATFSRFFRQNLLPKQRLLMGKYSDDLTDPFRHSKKASEYECQ